MNVLFLSKQRVDIRGRRVNETDESLVFGRIVSGSRSNDRRISV